jgi:hypothetical protein
MNKKFLVSVVAPLLLLAYFLITGQKFDPSALVGNVTSTVVDHSVKTEYGAPIKVLRVVDGDTIELANGDKLRYIGI